MPRLLPPLPDAMLFFSVAFRYCHAAAAHVPFSPLLPCCHDQRAAPLAISCRDIPTYNRSINDARPPNDHPVVTNRPRTPQRSLRGSRRNRVSRKCMVAWQVFRRIEGATAQWPSTQQGRCGKVSSQGTHRQGKFSIEEQIEGYIPCVSRQGLHEA